MHSPRPSRSEGRGVGGEGCENLLPHPLPDANASDLSHVGEVTAIELGNKRFNHRHWAGGVELIGKDCVLVIKRPNHRHWAGSIDAPPALKSSEQKLVTEEAGKRTSSTWRDLLWVVVAVVPLLTVYYYHFQSPKGPTGLIQSDMPQYSAEGREVFERGNGLSYPNPYDDDPNAPAIYFHWLLWLFGFSVTKLGLDPGYLTAGLGIVVAPLLGWLTLRLVDEVLESDQYRIPLFLLTMWGGGVICLASVIVNVSEGRWWREQLMVFDPGWNHNWGRNLIYSTEVVYHALVAWSWLSIFRQRWWQAIFAGFLLATTHPFSGLQLSGMLTAWWTLQVVTYRTGPWLWQWLACCAISAGFLGYNLVFLNTFPQHQAIQEILTLPHLLTNFDMAVAYGPVALIAVVRVFLDRARLTYKETFLLVAFAVSFLLSTHDRFLPIKPIEPKHFTRGYVWMPLFLLGLPLIQRSLVSLRTWMMRLKRESPLPAGLAARVGFHVLVWPAFGLAVFDNLCYNFLLFDLERSDEVNKSCFLSKEAKEAFEWIDANGLEGKLLCPGEGTEWYRPHRMTSYLAASYTSLRPYIGHHFMTPHIEERVQQVQAWFEGTGDHPWFEEIDYILVAKGLSLPLLNRSDWKTIYENEGVELLERIGRIPGRSAGLQMRYPRTPHALTLLPLQAKGEGSGSS